MKRKKDIEVRSEESKESPMLPANIEPGELSVVQVKQQVQKLQDLMRDVLIESDEAKGVSGHYGLVPGCGPKPALLKAGAEKICFMFRIRGIVNPSDIEVEDMIDLIPGHRSYKVTMHMMNSRGEELATGVGICSTMEGKYRYRSTNTGAPVPKEYWNDRDPALLGGDSYSPRKIDGQWVIFQRVAHDNPADFYNTCLKMAKKRCLGGNTPLFFRSPKGLVRSSIEGLWQVWRRWSDELFVPGVNGQWRKVLNMSRDDSHREVYRINLRDGSYIHASGDHRFPTSRGLKEVRELKEGESLLRSKIDLEERGECDLDYAWQIGLFIAEGHWQKNNVIRLTLNSEEIDFGERVTKSASKLGARVMANKRSDSNVLDVNIYSHAYAGLMRDFVHGDDCYNKHLTRFAYRQGEQFIQSILTGYLDGDGHSLEKGRTPKWILGFTGQNYELANDLRAISAVLNKRICLDRSSARCKGIEFPTFSGWIGERIVTYNQVDLEEITSIILEPRSAVLYDIEVDGDSLFCLANGIQTHNSMVDGTLSATAASDFFTQDLEPEEGAEHEQSKPSSQQPQQQKAQPETKQEPTQQSGLKFGNEKPEQGLSDVKRELQEIVENHIKNYEPELQPAQIYIALTKYDTYQKKDSQGNPVMVKDAKTGEMVPQMVPGYPGSATLDKISDKAAGIAIGKYRKMMEAAKKKAS